MLDDVVATAREYQDTAAERAVAIGVLPGGRAGTVQERCVLRQPPVEWIPVDDAVHYFVEVLEKAVTRTRDRIKDTEDEQVTQDLLIEISAALEKHYWMWQAENAK